MSNDQRQETRKLVSVGIELEPGTPGVEEGECDVEMIEVIQIPIAKDILEAPRPYND
jgi:hypothetical protein